MDQPLVQSAPRVSLTHVPVALVRWLVFTSVVCLAQLVLGASPDYLIGILFAYLCFGIAVWISGGTRTFPGFVITAIGLQGFVLAPILKLLYRQPGDLNLDRPLYTHLAYGVSTLSLGFGVWIYYRYFGGRVKPILPPITNLALLRGISYGLVLLSLILSGVSLSGAGGGNIVSQLSQVPLLAITVLTALRITESGGKHSFHPLQYAVLIPYILTSALIAARANFILPLAAYLVSCYMYSYRFKPRTILILAAYGVLFVTIASPWALASRSFVRGLPPMEALNKGFEVLNVQIFHPQEFARIDQKQLTSATAERRHIFYFSAKDTEAERLSLVKTSDLILEAVDNQGFWGWLLLPKAFNDLLPTALLPEGELHQNSNVLVHRVPGFLAPRDFTTGIVTGLMPDVYSAFGWPGLVLEPAILIFLLCFAWNLILDLNVAGNPLMIAFATYAAYFLAPSNVEPWIAMIFRLPIFTAILVLIITALGTLVVRRPPIRRTLQTDADGKIQTA